MDENDAGATITAVTTENTTSVKVDNDSFEVADGNLKLKAGSSLDFEAIEGGTVEVTITASGDGESATHTVTVTVNDLNEAPTIDVAGGGDDDSTAGGITASFTVAENSGDAVPGAAGAVLGLITLSDQDAGQEHTVTVNDNRFQIIDHVDAKWLTLKPGMSLNFEENETVMLTVTVTDNGDPAMSASQEVTITVTDVNEAPARQATKTLPDILKETGDAVSWEVDLTGLLVDPDEGDGNLVYSVDTPAGLLPLATDKLTIAVTYGTDADGNEKVTGTISSSKSIPTSIRPAAFDITISAADDEGLTGTAVQRVVVDDGDDAITAINLYDRNAGGTYSTGKDATYTVNVDETASSARTVLGQLTVDGGNDPSAHPNGQYKLEVVDDARFEVVPMTAGADKNGPWLLVLKAGQSLDHETDNGTVTVNVKAVDYSTKNKAGEPTGNPYTQPVTVQVNDENDAPTANKIGNWWVTVDEDLEAEGVTKGQWLTFSLDTTKATSDDTRPSAFEDVDSGKDGTLKYSLVSPSPSWLEIDASTGQITNKAGRLPTEGVHTVTVQATDGSLTQRANFKLTVAFSDANNADNDDPEVRDTSSAAQNDVNEGPGANVVVATFRIDDDDSNLTGHPFAPQMPWISAVVNDGNADDTNNRTSIAQNPDSPPGGYASAFKIVKAGSTYQIQTTKAAKALLNHETVSDIQITVSAKDGIVQTADTEQINIDVVDVNEAPAYAYAADTKTYAVGQSETNKKVLWINLSAAWEDPDENDNDGDLTFTATSNKSWIKFLHGTGTPKKWEDIKDGPDGDDDTTADNLTWASGSGEGFDDVNFGGGATPGDNDYVVVVEIDRTGANNSQADVGKDKNSFTLTARDDRGGPAGTQKINVSVTDQDLPAAANTVTLSGSARQGSPLTANFNEANEPDLAGDAEALLVVYTWNYGTVTDGNFASEGTRQISTSNTYTPTQADVGKTIQVSVAYSQLHLQGEGAAASDQLLAQTAATPATTARTTQTVSNAPDPAMVYFNILTNDDNDGLTAEVRIIDMDGVDTTVDETPDADPPGTPPVYTWQQSDNGVGGWTDVAADTDKADQALALADGKGKYYRLVVTYTDQGGFRERHESEAVKVGKVAEPPNSTGETLMAPSVGTATVGSTVSINNLPANASVQWQMQHGTGDNTWFADIEGQTGSLEITDAYGGKVLRALVTVSKSGDVTGTHIVQVNGGSAIAAAANSNPTKVKDYYVGDVGTGMKAGVQVNDTKGQNTVVEATVPVASLFTDADGDKLYYTVASQTVGNGPTDSNTADTTAGRAIFVGANNDHLVSFDARTGVLHYETDLKNNHDGNPADGQGNIVVFRISATDVEGGGTPATADVNIRLNTKPTNTATSEGTADTSQTVDMNETLESTVTSLTALTLNVLDENSPMHDFGKYTWTVDDARFAIKASATDSSQATLTTKAGQSFARLGAADKATGASFKVAVTATEKGDSANTVKFTITINVANTVTTNDPVPAAPADDVPGLVDNEASDDNEKGDGDGDSDNDGGWTEPPPPGMSIGGLIEDFVDNMDGFEQDLLEDFMLVIDDSIDIA